MKESGKLDINKRLTNHSARKYLLQKLRENNVEGTDSMQISGNKNVASINNYSKMSEEKHEFILGFNREVPVAQCLLFYVVFCSSLFVFILCFC